MPTSPDYIKGLLTHDQKVIESIYRSYAGRIERYILKRGGSVEDARDIFHDALMIIYRKAQEPNFELTSQFYTFLYGICYRLWDRKWRKKSSQTVTIPDHEGYIGDIDLEKEMDAREQHQVFRTAFQKLGEMCQRILTLFFAKKSMEEITREVGLKNAHTTRNRKYRCQKQLEKLVKNDPRYPELKQ